MFTQNMWHNYMYINCVDMISAPSIPMFVRGPISDFLLCCYGPRQRWNGHDLNPLQNPLILNSATCGDHLIYHWHQSSQFCANCQFRIYLFFSMIFLCTYSQPFEVEIVSCGFKTTLYFCFALAHCSEIIPFQKIMLSKSHVFQV